jgi:Ni,Fe-hydrogenase III small subunit/NAD-dependent dihydropyrimidine dehydrogenase PreA subunit
MLDSLKILIEQAPQTIPDVTSVELPEIFRGLPSIAKELCADDCRACADVCPTSAIELDPVRLDLGACVFCGECETSCPAGKITFTNNFRTATNERRSLLISEGESNEIPFHAERIRQKITGIFGRSLKLRQVSAGGCNACELELNACGNINFDMGRFGIEFVASPRHADGVVITGPISENMSRALESCYQATPAPKIVVLTGACAITGGIFRDSAAADRSFLSKYPIDLLVPGCPPHPLTFINGILRLIRDNSKS